MKPNAEVMTREEAKALSDEELDRVIERKYGTSWSPADFERGDPIGDEFSDRISRGR